MKDIESKLQSMDNVVNDRWQRYFTLEELEKRFTSSNNKLSDIPERSCECFI